MSKANFTQPALEMTASKDKDHFDYIDDVLDADNKDDLLDALPLQPPPEVDLLRPLEVEERRTLFLLKAHYPVTKHQVWAAFVDIFDNLRIEFAGQEAVLTKRLLKGFKETLPLQTYLFRRALHDGGKEERAWNNEIMFDVKEMMVEMDMAPYPPSKRPVSLKSLPPCSHHDSMETEAFDSTDEKMRCLHLIKTRFALSSLEAAAIMQTLFSEQVDCDCLVCDGFAQLLDEAHEDTYAELTRPIWRDVHAGGNGKADEQKVWHDLEKKILETADSIGISIAYASNEPPSSPRSLEQKDPKYLPSRSPSPYLEWEQQGREAVEVDQEAIKIGAVLFGKTPKHCYVKDSVFDAIGDGIDEEDAFDDVEDGIAEGDDVQTRRPTGARSDGVGSNILVAQHPRENIAIPQDERDNAVVLYPTESSGRKTMTKKRKQKDAMQQPSNNMVKSDKEEGTEAEQAKDDVSSMYEARTSGAVMAVMLDEDDGLIEVQQARQSGELPGSRFPGNSEKKRRKRRAATFGATDSGGETDEGGKSRTKKRARRNDPMPEARTYMTESGEKRSRAAGVSAAEMDGEEVQQTTRRKPLKGGASTKADAWSPQDDIAMLSEDDDELFEADQSLAKPSHRPSSALRAKPGRKREMEYGEEWIESKEEKKVEEEEEVPKRRKKLPKGHKRKNPAKRG